MCFADYLLSEYPYMTRFLAWIIAALAFSASAAVVSTPSLESTLQASKLPVGAKKNLPLLKNELTTFWSKFPDPALIA